MERTKGNETPQGEQGQERLSGRTAKGKGAGQHHPQMAAACSFGGGPGGCNPLGRSPEAAVSGQCPEVKPLGRVQGGSACLGVQRVKPFGPVGLMLAAIRTGYCLTHFVYQALAASPLFAKQLWKGRMKTV